VAKSKNGSYTTVSDWLKIRNPNYTQSERRYELLESFQHEANQQRAATDPEEATTESRAGTDKEDCEAPSAIESGMPWANFHITITGSVVAAYAAILSTITGAAQLWNYNRDRARIKVSAQNNMTMFGDLHFKNN